MLLSSFIGELKKREPNISITGNCDLTLSEVTERSSECSPESVFVMIRGKRSDGARYVEEARRRGCKIFINTRKIPIYDGECLIITNDSHAALADAAAIVYGENHSDMTIIGITGTKGKTTTAKILSDLLYFFGIGHLFVGTIGCEIRAHSSVRYETNNTTPDAVTLNKLLGRAYRDGVRVAIIEVSSQALKMKRIRGIPIFCAVFTNLSTDHIGEGEHSDFNEYRSCKRSLFTDYGANLAIVNADDCSSAEMARGVRSVITVGNSVLSDRRISRICESDTSVKFNLAGKDYVLPMPAVYNVKNAALAIVAAEAVFNLPSERLASAIETVRVPGRYEQYELDGVKIIIDYAHNEASFHSVMHSAGRACRGRLIAVFGSVGERSTERRAALAGAAEKYCDFSIITSDNPGREPAEHIARDILDSFSSKSRATVICDRKEAIIEALAIAKENDTVLLLGKGHESYQLIGERRTPFSEKSIIKAMGAVELF